MRRIRRHWAATLVFAMTISSPLFALSPDAQLEAALHRELVLGDLKGALALYQQILTEIQPSSAPPLRATAVRALFQMGQCFEKSARKAEAQAVYTRMISSYAEQTEFANRARLRLAAIAPAADSLPGPPTLSFALGGPGNVPPGWFLPVLPKTAACPAGSTCTVVLVPANAPLKITGDLAQSFSAQAYRGKTVRLRARMQVDGPDAAQLWIAIDRKGPGDKILDRPVAAGEPVYSSLTAHVEEDAVTFNFGVQCAGRSRVSLQDVSLEIEPGK
jgi:hypothetical protein